MTREKNHILLIQLPNHYINIFLQCTNKSEKRTIFRSFCIVICRDYSQIFSFYTFCPFREMNFIGKKNPQIIHKFEFFFQFTQYRNNSVFQTSLDTVSRIKVYRVFKQLSTSPNKNTCLSKTT